MPANSMTFSGNVTGIQDGDFVSVQIIMIYFFMPVVGSS
jgi:hypothetical protein